MKNFYLLYQPYLQITPQVGEQIIQQVAEQFHGVAFTQQVVEQKENTITPQLGEQIRNDIFSIGWGHHVRIIDKFKEQPELSHKGYI